MGDAEKIEEIDAKIDTTNKEREFFQTLNEIISNIKKVKGILIDLKRSIETYAMLRKELEESCGSIQALA